MMPPQPLKAPMEKMCWARSSGQLGVFAAAEGAEVGQYLDDSCRAGVQVFKQSIKRPDLIDVGETDPGDVGALL